MEEIVEKETQTQTRKGGTKTSKPPGYHDSNPLTTGWLGVRQLFANNLNQTIGVALWTVLLGVILGITALLIAASILVYLIMHNAASMLSLQLPQETTELVHIFNTPSIIATWIIGGLIVLAAINALEALQTSLAVSAAAGHNRAVKALVKKSIKRFWAVLGLNAFMLGLLLAAIMILGVLALVLGPIVLVVLIAACIAAIYTAVRVCFAPFIVVEEQLSPLSALKRSWDLSSGHFGEVTGIIMVAAIIILIPSALLDVMAAALSHSLFITLFNLVANLFLLSIGLTIVAMRYWQLRQIQAGALLSSPTHYLNYVAIVAGLIAIVIASNIAPSKDQMGQSGRPDYFEGWQEDTPNYNFN